MIDQALLDAVSSILDDYSQRRTGCVHARIEPVPTLSDGDADVFLWPHCRDCGGSTPYPWCHGNPTRADCISAGYCRKEISCGD